jgi:hypothetical protein
MLGGHPTRCAECGGSGRCPECQGSGVNCSLSDGEPRCRACHGSSFCPACDGSGSQASPDPLDFSVSVRFLLTAIIGFVLYEILIGNVPVLIGRGGPALPSVVAQPSAIGFSCVALWWIWKDVKRSDFKSPKEGELTSLFGDGDGASADSQHPRAEATPDEHPR